MIQITYLTIPLTTSIAPLHSTAINQLNSKTSTVDNPWKNKHEKKNENDKYTQSNTCSQMAVRSTEEREGGLCLASRRGYGPSSAA